MKFSSFSRLLVVLSLLLAGLGSGTARADEERRDVQLRTARVAELAKELRAGDVVFITVGALPFQKISQTTQSWVNHVGVVMDVSGAEPVIAESAIPFSRTTGLSRFAARSVDGRIAVLRLAAPLSDEQRVRLREASARRMGIHYDTGFDLHSKGQFCSRFVREVMAEATAVTLGEVQTFKELLAGNPRADVAFWRTWYFGSIPWQRETVTPASVFRSPMLHTVFDGFAV